MHWLSIRQHHAFWYSRFSTISGVGKHDAVTVSTACERSKIARPSDMISHVNIADTFVYRLTKKVMTTY